MTEIQRYIQRPNGMVSDGCGKWCIYSEAKNFHIKAMEAKDDDIFKISNEAKKSLYEKSKTIEAQAKEIERLKAEVDRLETYMQTLGGVM